MFLSLKSELGLRPVYHHKEERVSGHIFITVLAYHLVQVIRTELKLQGIQDSWLNPDSKEFMTHWVCRL